MERTETWLDSLSEDWVSEPRSSPNSLLKKSRIPRPSSATSGSTSKTGTSSSQNSACHFSKTSSKVLNESIQSKLNVVDLGNINGTTKTEQTASDYSLQSVQRHDVSRQPLDSSHGVGHGTPEWKKRLILGEGINGEQRDLFGPIGLESIFQPSSAQPKEQTKLAFRLPIDQGSLSGDDSILIRHVQQDTDSFEEGSVVHITQEEHAVSDKADDSLLDEAISQDEPPHNDSQQHSDESTEGSAPNAENPVTAPREISDEDSQSKEVSTLRPNYSRVPNSQGDMPLEKMFLPRGDLERENVPSSDPLSPHELPTLPPVDQTPTGIPGIEIQYSDWACSSLPGDLSMGTQEFVSKGGFINMRRGGYSNDGSFRNRMLSVVSPPSELGNKPLKISKLASRDTSKVPAIEEDTEISEDIPPKAPTPPEQLQLPRTPGNINHESLSPDRAKSSGSPLKIFNSNYDTFTKERLLRRISQLENPSNDEDCPIRQQSSPTHRSAKDQLPYIRRKSAIEANQIPLLPNPVDAQKEFGSGQLEGYDFKEDSTFMSSRSIDFDEDAENRPPVPQLQRNTQPLFNSRKAHSIRSFSGEGTFRTRQYESLSKIELSRLLQRNDHSVRRLSHDMQLMIIENGDTEDEVEIRDGKRPRSSPQKHPTPKRRRTLLATDENEEGEVDGNQEAPRAESTGRRTQSLVGKKKKGALYGNISQVPDPSIIRPSTPTPNQSRSKNSMPFPAEKGRLSTSASKKAEGEIADKSMQANDGTRKISVATQDYFEEANIIMSMIRARAQPELDGVEESQNEDDCEASTVEASFYTESTKEPFSRPPSREYVSMRKRPPPQVMDPNVVNQLKKFQESGNDEIDISPSFKSLRIDSAVRPDPEQAIPAPISEYGFESYPPNIRITESEAMQRKRKHSGSTLKTGQKSHTSSTDSPPPTFPTTSSVGSANKHILPCDAVSHLIPSQVAGMTYSSVRKAWVKDRRSMDLRVQEQRKEVSMTSDGDPFAGIPDLTVDMIQEMNQIQAERSPRKLWSLSQDSHRFEEIPANSRHSKSQKSDEGLINSRPIMRGNAMSAKTDASSTQSKRSILDYSMRESDTRATSLSHEAKSRKGSKTGSQRTHTTEEHTEEVEHEIKLHEGRSHEVPAHFAEDRQPRAVTITFSSSLISPDLRRSQGVESQSDASIWEDNDDSQDGKYSNGSTPSANRTSYSVGSKFVYRGAARRSSQSGKSFTGRPVSRIDEQDEISQINLTQNPLRSSLSLIVSTPLPLRDLPGSASMPPPSTSKKSNVTFHLDTLPDFTMNQVDEPFQLEVNYLANRNGKLSLKDAEASLSQAIDHLVRSITDVEPYEPYWEYIRSLDISKKGLVTLLMLSEFCDRIEDLDVSHNELGQVSGAPSTVRYLKAQYNCLSNLTTWNHLMNLQHLDISNNELESLDGFKGLIHLRELKADNNKVNIIDGILGLEGLMSLSLKGNRLQKVNFTDCELKRLTGLNMSNNELTEMNGLGYLPSLSRLDLDHNKFSSFPLKDGHVPSDLRILMLRDNRLKRLDVSNVPRLRALCVDRNQLTKVDGIRSTYHLNLLSMQDQEKPGRTDSCNLDIKDYFEIRKLWLSGNPSPSLSMNHSFLSLQGLSLASCGLQTLPASFGQLFPNVRVLNLNYNALKDIRPLLGIVRLTRLHLAGNRISRLRRTVGVLRKFSHLQLVDLRNNHLTVGFYPAPSTENQIVLHGEQYDEDDQYKESDHYVLSNTDEKADRLYRSRLDKGTGLRRRVYELLLASQCSRLTQVDGLQLDWDEVSKEHELCKKLVDLSVLKIDDE
ncbi:MAG: hypothetical protein M1834_007613 [Cirrosporium novae-zelandiae]|nr:MAG: hypothetical protein M1834_007613 [Cirrosporium novae-zelandiae]